MNKSQVTQNKVKEDDRRVHRPRLNDQKISRTDRGKRSAINAFLIFHLLAITCWCIPFDVPGILFARKLVRPYLLWSGLFQAWDMFAPTPKSANTYIEAQIRYKDGTTEVWPLPRMEHLNIRERFFKERYRKFADNLADEGTDGLRTDAAKHIARCKSTPANPVKLVVLVYYWSFISPGPNGSVVSQERDQHVLLGYGVRQEDLK